MIQTNLRLDVYRGLSFGVILTQQHYTKVFFFFFKYRGHNLAKKKIILGTLTLLDKYETLEQIDTWGIYFLLIYLLLKLFIHSSAIIL